ncbi:unnamed protein product [Musa hybrid cultivar]
MWAQAAGVNVCSAFLLCAIITRKNSYSGVRYSDEPAIFAWELINESRCESNSSGPLLQAWTAEMTSYIKSLDGKHLITVGLEGFYGLRRTERLRNIDLSSEHAYPDSWIPKASLEDKVKYLSIWVDSHVNDSEHVLKKPVLFAEVGSQLHVKRNGTYDRNILLKIVYDKVYESAKMGRAGVGALIWQLMVEGVLRFQDQFSLIASEHPSTYDLILQLSCRLRNFLMKKENTSEVEETCLELPP